LAIIPEQENNTISRVNQYHEQLIEKPRHHLGFSLLGHPCDRWLWLSFRWAVSEQFPGRIRRLFRRGQDEEVTAASDLRAIGVDLRETSRYQRTIYAGAHVQGSPDGIIYSGLPEAKKTMHIWECKTHSKKSFDELVKKGVEKAKWQHFVQMQCAMTRSNITRALYYAVCKDDDSLYTERIYIDRGVGEKYLERGMRITMSERLPEPLSSDSSWYQCKMCAAHGFCHDQHSTNMVNCRTCAHATPNKDSTWTCSRWKAEIPKDAQFEGCRSHVFHPDLVFWKLIESKSDEWNACWLIDELEVINGEDGYSSREILADGPFGDVVVDLVRDVMNGEIVAPC
jgi:hypothetical protein